MAGFYITIKNGLLESKHREKMKEAVWLFMWFLDKMTVINKEIGEGRVLGGKPITFEEVNEDLEMSKATYRRWIKILRDGNYIKTGRTPYGLSITVFKAFKKFNKRSIKNETSSRRLASTREVSKMRHQVLKNETSNVSKMRHQVLKNETSNIRQDSRYNKRYNSRQAFLHFFNLYPRKAKKKAAQQIWFNLKPNKDLQNKILTALENHKQSEQWIKGQTLFIPYPSNWLLQERWEEVMPVYTPKKISYYLGDKIIEKDGVRFVKVKDGRLLKFVPTKEDEKKIEWKNA